MKDGINIQIFPDEQTLATVSANLIINMARAAVKDHGRFVMALSGGHSPEGLYKKLSELPFRDDMPWDKTFIFWGDERYVPTDDPQNNAGQARQLLLNNVDISSAHVFPIPYLDTPELSAKQYEKTISAFFGNAAPCFDLILLGLGENGHTASLFPGSTALKDKRLIAEVFVEELNLYRITMTSHLINQACNIIFLVMGEEKADIVEKVIEGNYAPEKFPAQLIHPEKGNIYWLTDTAAVSSLKK